LVSDEASDRTPNDGPYELTTHSSGYETAFPTSTASAAVGWELKWRSGAKWLAQATKTPQGPISSQRLERLIHEVVSVGTLIGYQVDGIE